MILNNTLEVISYQAQVTTLSFILDATKTDVLEVAEGKDLELKAGSDTIGIWKGWTVTGVVDYPSQSSDGTTKTYTRLTAARALSSDTASAITSLEQNMQLVKNDIDSVKTDVQTTANSVSEIQEQINSIQTLSENNKVGES